MVTTTRDDFGAVLGNSVLQSRKAMVIRSYWSIAVHSPRDRSSRLTVGHATHGTTSKSAP